MKMKILQKHDLEPCLYFSLSEDTYGEIHLLVQSEVNGTSSKILTIYDSGRAKLIRGLPQELGLDITETGELKLP